MLGDVYQISGTPAVGQRDYPVIVSLTAPLSPVKGMAWMQPATHTLSIFNGTNWVAVTSGSALPKGTDLGQVLQTGAAPGFAWIADTDLDEGRYS
jgi:hypothetical protein